mmetsp:Transcript_17384/g.60707  ORF Transcript_17384/g.60707 Transcript_17384/m.60707 type:complete len:270 (+) Transcript_17384:419-1228(+)
MHCPHGVPEGFFRLLHRHLRAGLEAKQPAGCLQYGCAPRHQRRAAASRRCRIGCGCSIGLTVGVGAATFRLAGAKGRQQEACLFHPPPLPNGEPPAMPRRLARRGQSEHIACGRPMPLQPGVPLKPCPARRAPRPAQEPPSSAVDVLADLSAPTPATRRQEQGIASRLALLIALTAPNRQRLDAFPLANAAVAVVAALLASSTREAECQGAVPAPEVASGLQALQPQRREGGPRHGEPDEPAHHRRQGLRDAIVALGERVVAVVRPVET